MYMSVKKVKFGIQTSAFWYDTKKKVWVAWELQIIFQMFQVNMLLYCYDYKGFKLVSREIFLLLYIYYLFQTHSPSKSRTFYFSYAPSWYFLPYSIFVWDLLWYLAHGWSSSLCRHLICHLFFCNSGSWASNSISMAWKRMYLQK